MFGGLWPGILNVVAYKNSKAAIVKKVRDWALNMKCGAAFWG